MRQTISEKKQKLSKEYKTFMRNIEKYLEIANEVTESISDATNDENAEKTISYEQRCNVAIKNLNIFVKLFQKFNQEIYESYSMLDLAGKSYDIVHFTYPESNVDEYKVNDVGECVIANIDSVPQHHCHIFNVKKPPLQYLDDFPRKRFTTLPGSGEVFAIDLGSDGLCRAVRSDFVNEGSETMRIQLIDTGGTRCVRKDCKNIYELPKAVQDIKSRAMLCKVVEVVNQDGISLITDECLKKFVGKHVFVKIVKIRNSIPFIKITANSPNTIKEEELDSFENNSVDLLSDDDVEYKRQVITVAQSTETGYFDKLTAVAESIVAGELVETVTEAKNTPNIEATAILQQLLHQKNLNDENTAIAVEPFEEVTARMEVYKAPENTKQNTGHHKITKKVSIASRVIVPRRCENSVTTRVTHRMPRQRKIPSRFSEDTCVKPNKRTLKMNCSILGARERTKVDSARNRATERNKLQIDDNEPSTSKHSNQGLMTDYI